ncbi:MAG TPA: hypothetical protein VG992_02100 [Candidatus Saccharimonadales bacterium]|nr:hypothetical protein [Candidatus Saccharimonadales bacterium]
MIHIQTLEQPAFAPETENEVYELEWLARDILADTDLWQRIKAHRKEVVDINSKVEASDLSLQADEARLVLGGLQQVKKEQSKLSRGQIASDMLMSYEKSRTMVASPRPQLVAA